MPPTAPRTAPPEAPPANPTDAPTPDDAKADSRAAKSDDKKAPDLFVIVAPNRGLVELHSEETAAARVSALTYGSKQHRKEAEENDEPLPEGGGGYEYNRRDIHVYKLAGTPVTDF